MHPKQELAVIKAQQEMMESQINYWKNLGYLREDLQVLGLMMIINFERKNLMNQEDLPILTNFLILHLEQVLAMLMLKIKELLVNLYQESTILLEQVELVLAMASEAKHLSNQQL